MSDDKDSDRARRKKRRSQLEREKEGGRASTAKSVHQESKASDATRKLDLRIGKLIDEGYSPDFVAKRLGVTIQRINRLMSSSSAPPGNRLINFLLGPWPVVALIVCYLALGLTAASRKTVTGDEGTHLLGGYSYWKLNDYRLNPESGNFIQRWDALPVWLSGYDFPAFRDPRWQQSNEYDLALQFLFDSGNDADRMLMLGRMMTSILGTALGLLVYHWSRRLFGPIGGLISLTLFAFSPTMLTHGFLVLADLSVTFFLLASVGALWRLMHRISLGNMALSCLALSGLFLSKVSAATVLPMALLMLVVWLLNRAPLVIALPGPREVSGLLRKLTVLIGALFAIALGVWFFIWAAYGFRYSMANPAIQPASQPPELFPQAGFLSDVGCFAAQNHLLPEAFLYSYSYMLSRTQGSRAFFNGEYGHRGWLAFFPYAVAVKTPIEFFLILWLAGVAAWLFRVRSKPASRVEPLDGLQSGLLYQCAPLLILFCVFWAFALTSHFNIGHRHVLATYPPMFIFAGAASWWIRPPVEIYTDRQLAPIRIGIALLLVISVVDALLYWPHYLAYFNQSFGGPRHAYKHLVDSSLDWAQNVKELKRWLNAHPDDSLPPHRVYLSQFGKTPPKYYGIQVIDLPSFVSPPQTQLPEPLAAGATASPPPNCKTCC